MFNCDECGKQFEKATALNGHKLVHATNFKETNKKRGKAYSDAIERKRILSELY